MATAKNGQNGKDLSVLTSKMNTCVSAFQKSHGAKAIFRKDKIRDPNDPDKEMVVTQEMLDLVLGELERQFVAGDNKPIRPASLGKSKEQKAAHAKLMQPYRSIINSVKAFAAIGVPVTSLPGLPVANERVGTASGTTTALLDDKAYVEERLARIRALCTK